MGAGGRAKKLIGGIYSWAADTVYEPLVVNGAFEVFGGAMKDLVVEQGRAAAEHAAGRPILDLPVGTATFTISVAKASSGIVVGADIAAGMVRQARFAAAGAGVHNLPAVQADAHALPFGDRTFAAVLCTNGLQVMPGLSATLRELHRVLTEDGVLFVSVVNLPLSSAPDGPTLLMSRPQLRRAMQAAGFEIVSLRTSRLATLVEARLSPRGQGDRA